MENSSEDFRLLFDAHPLPMWVFDSDSLEFLEVNEAAVRRYEYSREEFLLMRITDIRPEEAPRLMMQWQQSLGDLHASSFRHSTKSGKLIDVEVIWHRVRFGGRKAVLVVAQDITQRRILEEQLRQAHKMEAVGRLAGGIAHDFNNLLTIISGYSQLLQAKVEPGHAMYEGLEHIRGSAERAAALTRQLLAFSKRQFIQPVILDLNSAISKVEHMLQRMVGESIRLELSLTADLACVHADPNQVEQILVNLVMNARDAMPKGGMLTIQTANADLPPAEDTRQRSGSFVMLAIGDTGAGAAREVRTHIFEPFFTTKQEGAGPGLGLSTVYGIVQQNGGRTVVTTQAGEGSTVRVYLPAVSELTSVGALSLEQAAATAGSETVLVVDDEVGVRVLMAEALRRYGYQVLEADEWQQALRIADGRQEPVDILLCDVIMPEKGCQELAAALRRLWPGLKVLYFSGGGQAGVAALAAREAYLQKPFSGDVLARSVRDLLDRAG